LSTRAGHLSRFMATLINTLLQVIAGAMTKAA